VSLNNPPDLPASFEDVYAEHSPLVLRLVVLFRIPAPDRADVAQEVWIDVYQSLPLYDASKGTARAWLAGITHNAARDWKRTRRRRSEFSRVTGEEPPDPRPAQPEESAEQAQRREALAAFVERAIPDEAQRLALLLHEIEGLTVEEVAQATGVSFWKAQWRIKMARSKLRAAEQQMTEEERERFRAVVLPLGGVDGILRALREAQPPVDDEIAEVWDRVVERIEAEGGSIHDRLGGPATTTPPSPKLYTFTGPSLASALAGVFLLGGIAGAGALYAFLSRDHKASVTIDAEIPPAPAPTAEQSPEPAPTARAAPNVSSSPPPSPWESEAWILDRALKAKPAEALRLADLHALRFPRSIRAAAREEIAIGALVKLGEHAKAEERAAKLLRWAPGMAPRMEELFGRSPL